MKRFFPAVIGLMVLTSVPAWGAEAVGQWQGTVARMIASHQNYPRSAQIRGEEGTTRLRVALAADGKVGQVDLAASSGSAILDREAQSVVSGIGKFPPPPAGATVLLVPIVWRLN